ncbi:hypothetical protein WN943_002046 [Citrus x changshan-huyou]
MYQPLAVTVSHFLCTQILDLRAESSDGGQSKAVVDCLKESSSLASPKHEEEFFVRKWNVGGYGLKIEHHYLQK